MDFKSNPFIWIWIGYRLDFGKSNPCPPLAKAFEINHLFFRAEEWAKEKAAMSLHFKEKR